MSPVVKVITDSACDLPDEILKANDIEIVPLSIRFDEHEYVDRVELSIEEFWTKAGASSDLPATAAPSPGAFEAAFKKAASQGHSGIICINLSSKLSATYQAAVSAAKAVEGEIEVRVVDSETVTVALGSICIEASERARAGASLDEVEQAVRGLCRRMRLLGTLDTLENLRKGGRIGAAGAFFASILSVKPVITIEQGEVKPIAKTRTRTKAMAQLAQLVIDQGPLDHVGVAHAQAPDVQEFVELLSPVVSPSDVLITEIGPTIGTHGGPRLLAVSFAVAD